MAANCALYPHNWAVWGGFNKINKLTGRPPPAPEARGGQSLTKDQFVIARGAGGQTINPKSPRRGARWLVTRRYVRPKAYGT